jgi:aminoglycoside/choline kinase family phosphotransferase
VLPLTGDASDRRYFRVILEDDGTQVLAVHPGAIEFTTMPFVKVAKLLSLLPVPIPAILSYSNPLGVIGLEDLGDVTLQAHLGTASPAEHKALYREAVALIDALQRRGAALASPEYPPYAVAFDVDKLTWELDFFLKNFMEGYRGIVLPPSAREALRAQFASIVEELAAEPRVLCHRDYHSRNLMLHQGKLYIIDFQDARMGPDTYDLVSLLRDSYVDLPEDEVGDLIAFFLALRCGPGGKESVGDGDEFRRRFDLMALQRNLKALGTFGFQTISRGNPVYIQYIPRTLTYVRANLERYPRFGRLRELLAAHLEELGQ